MIETEEKIILSLIEESEKISNIDLQIFDCGPAEFAQWGGQPVSFKGKTQKPLKVFSRSNLRPKNGSFGTRRIFLSSKRRKKNQGVNAKVFGARNQFNRTAFQSDFYCKSRLEIENCKSNFRDSEIKIRRHVQSNDSKELEILGNFCVLKIVDKSFGLPNIRH